MRSVLYLDWSCFGGKEVCEYFNSVGYEVVKFAHEDYRERQSESFMKEIGGVIKENDFAFAYSYNYYPLMARACKEYDIKYIAFVYDSPHVTMYSYTITYPTNYVFVFDSAVVQEFRNNGIETIYYMPLPTKQNRMKSISEVPFDIERVTSDISFVGALYNEDHNLLDNVEGLSDRTRGYLEGLIKAQSKVYGYNFIQECLKDEIIEELQKLVKYNNYSDGIETLKYIYGDYFLCRKLTTVERIDLLSAVAEKYKLKLFTIDEKSSIENAENMGVADYFTEMPFVFANSKINLNISMRSIRNGIPLRCMDIMSCGGFLLTNYQSDFLEHFVPGEDFVFFESKEDMLRKIDYYMTHEDERIAIAEAGQKKVNDNYNYQVIFKEIFDIAGID